MSNLVVGPGVKVTLHFALHLDTGEVVDSNFDGEPATFVVGDGSMLPGFESKLFGMAVGDHQQYSVDPEDSFGQPNPSNVQSFKLQEFSTQVVPEPGLVVSFADANRDELPGVVTAVEGDQVTVDFNHPLAGRRIRFEAKIVALQPEVTH